jgi:uncharacterized BrkB/YihY/UPF0761 family membrane protein
MQETRRLFCILCMVLILTFAIVHFSVGIGIIVRFRHYDDIFHPERGLAGYNIFISLYALIVCGFGLYSILTNQHTLSKYIFFLLGIIIFTHKYDTYFFSR